MYRGDKDLRLGKILAEKFKCEYIVIAQTNASPADSRIFGISEFPMDRVGKLPEGFEFRLLRSKTIFFNKKNISLGGFFQITPKYLFGIGKSKPNLILENAYTTLTPRMYQSFVASKLFGIPVVYIDAGDIPAKRGLKRLLLRFESLVVRNASKIITYNELGKDRFVKEYEAENNRIAVIPKPVDIRKFNPNIKNLSSYRKEFGIEDKFIVGYFGRLDRNKGSQYLVEAAKIIEKDMKNDEILFIFVGSNIVDKDATFIRELYKRYELKNVHFFGMIPHEDMPYAYALADIVVYPDVTHLPGFSTVLAETMAMGKPVILGIKGFEKATPIKHMETGVIINPCSPEEIIGSIFMLKNDKSLRLKLSHNVRAYAENNMDWDIITEKYYEIFKEVLNDRSRK